MGEAMITRRGGGGGKLNAIIEQYQVAAGGSVSANGFVKFVDGMKTHSLNGIYPVVMAVALTNNKVLVVYGEKESVAYYGSVLELTGAGVSIGTRTQIGTRTSKYVAPAIELTKINETRALLLYNKTAQYLSSSSSTIPKYVIIGVDDDTITALATASWGTDTSSSRMFDLSSYRAAWMQIADQNELYQINMDYTTGDNRVYIHRYLVSDTSVTWQTAGSYASYNDDTGLISNMGLMACVKLSNGNYLAIHKNSKSGDNYSRGLSAHVCIPRQSNGYPRVSPLTTIITPNRNNEWYLGDAVLLANGNVLLVFLQPRYYSLTTGYMYGIVINVNGTNITTGTLTKLNAVSRDASGSSTELGSETAYALRGRFGGLTANGNNVQLIYHPNAMAATYTIDISVNDMVITAGEEKEYIAADDTHGTYCDAIWPNGKALVYTLIDGETKGAQIVNQVESIWRGTVDGVAVDDASAGETVDVYRPA